MAKSLYIFIAINCLLLLILYCLVNLPPPIRVYPINVFLFSSSRKIDDNYEDDDYSTGLDYEEKWVI